MQKAVMFVGVAVVAVVLAIICGWLRLPESSQAPRIVSNAVDQGLAEPAGAEPRATETRVPAEQVATREQWVEQLLYGEADGVVGYLHAVNAIRDGSLQRTAVGCSVLAELASDNAGAARLRNVSLPLAVLVQDLQPAPEVVSARATYLDAVPRSPLHTELMRELAAWPTDAATAARIDELLHALDRTESPRSCAA